REPALPRANRGPAGPPHRPRRAPPARRPTRARRPSRSADAGQDYFRGGGMRAASFAFARRHRVIWCKPMTRYIFITGGVASSLGKGLSAAALGALLQARGYSVRLRKLDPYLNVDPGTMSPYQHGEVYVTDDGAETDLDLGHY